MARTIGFDRDEVIEKAMNTFWEKGYENTSLKDLLDSTGLLKGSLYNSFSSKENLFLLCLEKYGERVKKNFYKEGDPLEYLKNFFTRLVDDAAGVKGQRGCLIMNTCVEFGKKGFTPALKNQVLFKAIEKNFSKVIEKAIENDLLSSERSTSELTGNLVTAAFSIREISKFKKDKAFLLQIANNGLQEFGIKI